MKQKSGKFCLKLQKKGVKRGISLLGGLSLLGSGLIFPQSASTTSALLIPDPASEPAPANSGSPSPQAPQAVPKPSAPVAPLPAATAPVAPPPPTVKAPVSEAPKVPLSAPRIAVPAPQAVKPSLLNAQPNPASQMEGKNSLIDTTPYSLENLQRYAPPSAIVLTGRTNGCQIVAQNGKLQQGSCDSAASQPASRQPVTLRANSPTIAPPIPIASRPRPVNSPVNSVGSPGLKPLRWQGQNFTPKPLVSVSLGKLQGLSLALAPLSPAGQTTWQYSVPGPDNQRTSLIFPLPIPAAITSAFGWRMHPISGSYRPHLGTDIAAPLGTPVLAAYGGEVAVADWQGGYGLMVSLRHEEGKQESRYAHLSEIYVQPGQWVEQGTVIGRVGSTGYSTGPHLHFEWRHLTSDGWVAVDAGLHLEYALENLVRSLQVAKETAKPQG